MYALDLTLSQYEVRRAAGTHLSSSAPLLSVDEGLVPLHTADDLVRQYNCGDLNSTLFASVDERSSVDADDVVGSPSDVAITRQINDYFRSELIDKRNRRMAMRIDRLLTDRPDLSFFFAFGAGTTLLIRAMNTGTVRKFRGAKPLHFPPSPSACSFYSVILQLPSVCLTMILLLSLLILPFPWGKCFLLPVPADPRGHE